MHSQAQLTNRGTHTCRHAQRHQQKPSATGSQVSANPPSQTSFQDRQTESNTRHPHCHWYLRWCCGDTHAPTWTCLRNSHTSARHELPAAAGWANLSAGHRDPSTSVGAAMRIALVANKDSATANLWSDTGRGEGEGKRTLCTREVSVFLSDWEEGHYISSFPSDSGSDCFSFITLGTEHKSNLISLFDTAQQLFLEQLSLPGGGDSRLSVSFMAFNSRLCLLMWKGRKCKPVPGGTSGMIYSEFAGFYSPPITLSFLLLL